MSKRRSFSKVLGGPGSKPLSKEAMFASGGEQLGKWEVAGTDQNVWSHRTRVANKSQPGEMRHSLFSGSTFQFQSPAHDIGDADRRWYLSRSSVDMGVVVKADEILLESGPQARGFCSIRVKPTAGDTLGTPVPYQGYTEITNVPSSITFSNPGTTDVNVTSVAAADKTTRGFRFDVVAAGAGVVDVQATRSWVTVGN